MYFLLNKVLPLILLQILLWFVTESLMKCLALYSKTNSGDGGQGGRVGAWWPRTSTHSHTTLFQKRLSSSKWCKGRAARLALLLPCIWTIYKLKNTDFLFCSCGASLLSDLWPPALAVFAAPPPSNQPFNILPHIANKARTIKAVLKKKKNIFTQMEKNKSQH